MWQFYHHPNAGQHPNQCQFLSVISSEARLKPGHGSLQITSSDVYSVWFPGSTSATESWECWIICMEQIQCSDKPKPMRDTGSSSASHRSQKASPRHPRGQSEPRPNKKHSYLYDLSKSQSCLGAWNKNDTYLSPLLDPHPKQAHRGENTQA
uniref:Fatty acid hydroxylase domain containing 2 n=1 Tax=Buteo japonicus TaxID=224669 RepID=A0A8C0B1A3_9AVES